jgi:hypothetical protein
VARYMHVIENSKCRKEKAHIVAWCLEDSDKWVVGCSPRITLAREKIERYHQRSAETSSGRRSRTE